MNFDTLRKIYGKLAKNDNIKDVKTLNKCKKFLNDLPEPQDEIDRSYLQYLTQQYYPRNGILHFFEKIYSKIKLNKTISLFTENKPIFKDNADAVFYNPLGKKIVPQEVSSQYANIVIDDGTDNLLLLDKDCRFIAEIRKRYKDVFFIFKLVCKIAIYRNLIEKYKPKAIIATAEYSFCSSALTRFCRDNGVKHINIMHGEKLFDMRATFFEFDNCYIWDSFYEDLFLAQRAKAEQFIIALPESLKFSRHDVEQIIDLKVYLSDETKAELKVLKKKLDIIKITNPLNIKKICIRPHPIYTSLKTVKKLFGEDYKIENCLDTDIEKSILESRYIMARYSTVLSQAVLNEVKVIIDDCSSPKLFKMLPLLKYRLLSLKNVIKLSDIVK